MAKKGKIVEAKETPLPWKILERNQKLRDGREVVDLAGDTSKSPYEWEIVAAKMLVPDARRAVAAMHACKSISTEALAAGVIARLVENIRLQGGGDIYLEEFGRYCFCSGCYIGETGPVTKDAHSSVCNDLNAQLERLTWVQREMAEIAYRINEPEAKGEIKG